MSNQISTQISKSDFMLYCEAPRHLWAKKHGKAFPPFSDFVQYLINEGSRVEALAQMFLTTVFLPQHPGDQLLWQQTYIDEQFISRLDALIYKSTTNTYDLYEIKSSTGVDKDIVYDVTFQAVILEKHIPVDHYYVLHPNKEYIRSGELDLDLLFVADDITEKVNDFKAEVLLMREEALRVAQLADPDEVEHCLMPKDCPCPQVCHPDLPEFSIYDIPRLSRIKKVQLLADGIRAAKDIPLSFDLNDKQRLIADLARTNADHIDKHSLHDEMRKIEYPLYFLDYETCISAIPQYDGYHPQQQIVFQYSLHKIDQPSGNITHTGHISIAQDTPSLSLLEQLSSEIGQVGTVIVWNKSFEMTMNRNMAKLHPEYADFLENVNNRIYDLGDIVNLGYYLQPGFKGSWSIKNVLPVMVKELTYEGLAINKGDQASITWWNITFGDLTDHEKKVLIEGLEKYCELDTLAMVEIYKKFLSTI